MVPKKKHAPIGLACLFTAVILPLFLQDSRYYMNVLNFSGIFIILTYSLNFIHGYLGLISLGQAGFFAIGAYLTAGLTMGAGINYFPALLLSAGATALVGIAIGYPATRVGGHYFVLITLAFGEIVRLVILNWKAVTNGTNGINGIPAPSLGGFVFESRLSYYYIVLGAVVLAVLATKNLRQSKYGRSMLSLKSDELTATVCGVNPVSNKLINFCLSGFFAGLAGGLYASYIGSISPEAFSIDLSIDILTMGLVGGSGTIAGPIIGTVFLVVLKEWLRFLREYYMILYGAGIVAVMVFMPKGIMGVIHRFTDKYRGGLY
jgi:branched-chain amino acid transport system permease protein